MNSWRARRLVPNKMYFLWKKRFLVDHVFGFLLVDQPRCCFLRKYKSCEPVSAVPLTSRSFLWALTSGSQTSCSLLCFFPLAHTLFSIPWGQRETQRERTWERMSLIVFDGQWHSWFLWQASYSLCWACQWNLSFVIFSLGFFCPLIY